MKKILIFTLCSMALLWVACGGPKEERFNYTLIKSKLDLTTEQVQSFDEITSSHLKRARAIYEGDGDKATKRQKINEVWIEQDQKIKTLINNKEQYAIYIQEMNIERKGREQHNMSLIKKELALDSLQTVQYDLANEAFYKTLIDNHDNYHGKPDVYKKYYAELNKSRIAAFEQLMRPEQYQEYLKLAEKYQLEKSEH